MAVMCVAMAAAVMLWYWANGGAQGQRLIERVICLAWPITVRLIYVVLPIVFSLAWTDYGDKKLEEVVALIGYAIELVGAIWLAVELRKLSGAPSIVEGSTAVASNVPPLVPAAAPVVCDDPSVVATNADVVAARHETTPDSTDADSSASDAIPLSSGGSMSGLWWVFRDGNTPIAVRHSVYRPRAEVYVGNERVAAGSDFGSPQVLPFEHQGVAYTVTLRDEARAPGGIRRSSATLARGERVLQTITLRHSVHGSRIGVAVIAAITIVAQIVFQLRWWWAAPIGIGLLLVSLPLLLSLLCEVEAQSPASPSTE